MAVNRDKPDLWKEDIINSVDMYNTWFLEFAPFTFRKTRIETTKAVEKTLKATSNLTDISMKLLEANPSVLPTLRMSTCPPLAVDRLIGLTGVNPNLIKKMEDGELPKKIDNKILADQLEKISLIIRKMADPDIFVWLNRSETATDQEIYRAATIVADRLCGSVANPIIRNAQEQRQLSNIGAWLDKRGYSQIKAGEGIRFDNMQPGTYSFRLNVPITREDGNRNNIPIDVVIMPNSSKPNELPLLVEAKSAGDFTNVNKRRKEEATKIIQLRRTYKKDIRFILFLCGYFDSGYLGYEAAEGIDWVWEHRIDDLAEFGL